MRSSGGRSSPETVRGCRSFRANNWLFCQIVIILNHMDAKTQARLTARANVFKALAHPSRLLIVEELARQAHCVCELTEMIGADMSTVSKHLSVLKSAGIVQDEKRGLQVYYRLKMPCVLRFFDCVGEVIETNVKEQWELVNLR
jgi:DNA-binding transcriptional ArsR family regulator